MFITVTCSTYIEACTCLLKPVRINTCLTCPTSHLQRMRSCQLFELRDELKDMEQIVLEIGEALLNKHNTRHEVLSEAANQKPKGTNISQAHLLKNIYSNLQELLLNINMLRHHGILDNTDLLTVLTAKLNSQLCAIHSMLKTEQRLFDKKLEIPSCSLSKPEWRKNRGSHKKPSCSECTKYAVHVVYFAIIDMKQHLADLDQFF